MESPTAMSLLPTGMAVPVYVAEDVAVGRCVFQNFMHEEFEEEGVSDEIFSEVPEDVLEEEILPDRVAAPPNYADENFATALNHVGPDPLVLAMEIGVRIRECADAFAKSEQRKKIRDEADRVNEDTIGYEEFRSLCDQVFKHGFNKENIVALFCFCADIVIKCVREGKKEVGVRLFRWALRYVVEQEKAIRNTFSTVQIAAMGAGVMAIVAVGGFFIYKWST